MSERYYKKFTQSHLTVLNSEMDCLIMHKLRLDGLRLRPTRRLLQGYYLLAPLLKQATEPETDFPA